MDAEAKTRVTFAEYMALPETNQIVELIDGEIIMNPPNFRHQKILRQIIFSLQFSSETGELCIAPTGVRFDDTNIPEPDLFWVSAENQQCFLEENGSYWHGAPDLIIEILSPSTASVDRGHKFDIYEKYGVREYWLIDPEARFSEIYRHENGKFERQGVFKAGQSFTSAVLGGATIETKSWFGE